MYLSTILTLTSALAAVIAAPVDFPAPDGFPNPNPAQIAGIETQAGGNLPNAPLPITLKEAAITTLELLANVEIFEVAFFTELLNNVTDHVAGYDVATLHPPLDRAYTLKAINAIVAQEKLHAIAANGLLASTGHSPIAPCKYTFPANTFPEAILFAETFTDIALGTAPAIQVVFAEDGGNEIFNVPLLGAILAQEGEQAGYFRYLQGKTPSAAPFLTGGTGSFALSALELFVVPGSCPRPFSTINIPAFKPLTILTKPQAKNMTLKFSVTGSVDAKQDSIVYLSGANLPLTVPISSITKKDGKTSFKAQFPFEAGFANGLTIAALVKGNSTAKFFTDDDVATATIAGPGIILVD